MLYNESYCSLFIVCEISRKYHTCILLNLLNFFFFQIKLKHKFKKTPKNQFFRRLKLLWWLMVFRYWWWLLFVVSQGVQKPWPPCCVKLHYRAIGDFSRLRLSVRATRSSVAVNVMLGSTGTTLEGVTPTERR